jgi:hypothetical protein
MMHMDTRSLLVLLVVAAFGLPEIAHTLDSKAQQGTQELPPSHSANLPASPPRWVFFDFESGIKTIELADGSIHEEPFEPERTTQSLPSTLPAEKGVFDPVETGSVQTR